MKQEVVRRSASGGDDQYSRQLRLLSKEREGLVKQ
jgi:hypothetical protein